MNKCLIALIAVPRTGTNFLCSLLNYHPLITSYFEVFNPQKFYSGYKNKAEDVIQRINQQYSYNFLNSTDPKLINWIHNNPTKLFNILVSSDPEQYISFKLFPNHLKSSTIQSEIINNKNIKKILVKRNLLDTYISHEIALKTNKWDNFDTSQVRISLSVEKFAHWLNWVNQWYYLFEKNNSLEKKQCFTIYYEDIHSSQTNQEKIIYCSRFLETIGLDLKTDYNPENINHFKINKKQDARKNPEEKIINYQDFIQRVKEKGLDKYCELNS